MELMLPDGLDPISPSFTVRDVTTELGDMESNSSESISFLKITDTAC
ncbi:unnamed protein product [Schistosoma curassoni]|uniref:Uncharacterized protein n=1 Tax=Schistosoma curassoni TaxID=6186 RepID=A0A183KUD5_9TREM|nr:unnamed protein product [Schistosoma curassoni]